MIIAVDFDGTIVEDRFPEIGEEKAGAVDALKKLKKEGYALILWTCRTGIDLARAVAWCAEQGIRFDAINQSLRFQVEQYNGSDPRKVGASLYIDDRGLQPLPEWDEIYRLVHEKLPTRDELLDIEYSNC